MQRMRSVTFLPLVLALAVLCLYGAGIRDEPAWYDSAEFVVAALRLDVPHQPGYPLYTMAANLFLRLPLPGSPAARLSLLSALAAAVALGLLLRLLLKRGSLGTRAALVAVVAAAVAPSLWEAAQVCEVYTVELFFLALAWIALERLRRSPKPSTLLLLAVGLAGGTAAAHRPSALGLFPAALLLLDADTLRRLVAAPGRLRRFLALAAGVLLAVLPYAYLLVRLGSPDLVVADPRTPATLGTVWDYWTGADYRRALFAFGPLEMLVRLRHLTVHLATQLALPLLLLLPLGARRLAAVDPSLGRAILAVIAVNAGFVASYNAMEGDTMLLPTVLGLAIASGYGLDCLTDWLGRGRGATAVALVVALAAVTQGSWLLERDRLTGSQDLARTVSALVPPGGRLLVSNDVAFRPFLYQRWVEGRRRDMNITVIDALNGANEAELLALVRGGGMVGPLLHPPESYGRLRADCFLSALGPVYGLAPRVPPFTSPLAAQGPALAGFGSWRLRGLSTQVVPVPDAPRARLWSLAYDWEADVAAPPVVALLVAAGPGGALVSDHGALVFHDVHVPFDGYLPAAAMGAGRPRRELRVATVPAEAAGVFDLWLCLVPSEHPALARHRLAELRGVNYLNYDGFEQVFRLRRGQRVGEPFWNLPTLADVEGLAAEAGLRGKGGSPLVRVGSMDLSRVPGDDE